MMLKTPTIDPSSYVPESKFGIWFLSTDVWDVHVLEFAVNDLKKLIKNPKPTYPVIVDLGCGSGRSFKLLKRHFAPDLIIGADIDAAMLHLSALEAEKQGINVELIQGTSSNLALANQSVDMLFCHQTFHHLVDQEGAIQEFYRILKPGGILLFAESTRTFIHSWIIRLLFRHPMHVQKSAAEYLDVIRRAGFKVEPNAISYPYLWWSRADLGIQERLFRRRLPPVREETLLNLAALRD